MDPPRVPAWKRLGLKLKYAAQETNTASSVPLTSLTAAANDSMTAEDSASPVNGHPIKSPPSKKQRLEGHSSTSARETTNGLNRSSSLRSSGSTLRKSVSFTPETKVDDGESSNFMQDKWDEEARNDQINDYLARQAEDVEAAVKSQISVNGKPAESSESATIVRKPKRAKAKRTSLEQHTMDSGVLQPKLTPKSKDALDYLQCYHNARSAWKFSKNREVWLLKHFLSIADIPTPYETALFNYLGGMKSENAKSRLMDQCHDYIVDQVASQADESERTLISKSLKMDTIERQLAYYRTAMERFEKEALSISLQHEPQEGKSMALQRHECVNRAANLLELILNSKSNGGGNGDVGQEAPHAGMHPERQSLRDGLTRKAVPKKRKNRTAVIDVASSSDTTSSESSSDNSSETDM